MGGGTGAGWQQTSCSGASSFALWHRWALDALPQPLPGSVPTQRCVPAPGGSVPSGEAGKNLLLLLLLPELRSLTMDGSALITVGSRGGEDGDGGG